jgi:long-chain acyl-CoA synthetase
VSTTRLPPRDFPKNCAAQADSVVRRVFQRGLSSPDAIAFIVGPRYVSYREFLDLVGKAARALLVSGVERGDRVMLSASNSLHFAATYMAIHLCGAIAVPIDPGAPAARIQMITDRVAARVFLPPEDQISLMRESCAPWWPNLSDNRAWPLANDAADIMFTSGTTGVPKGVVLAHGNLCAAAEHINAFVGTTANDIELLALPLAHSFGLGTLRSLLVQGASAILIEGFAFPGQIFDSLQRHRATGFRFVPSGLATLSRASGDRLGDFSETLRYVELGSASLAIEDKQRLMRLLPHTRLCMHYGLTEASRSVYIEFHQNASHLNSIGRPIAGVDVRILGEHGELLPPQHAGEICIRGPHVMQGYWLEPDRSGGALQDEWLHTGDIGFTDEDGFLYLQGRRSDMINVGGRKVSPVEVEDVLHTHPSISECACTGIPDPDQISGEIVAALVVPRTGGSLDERELDEFSRCFLEPYKIPRRWVIGGSIPRTHNGKIQRHLLRDQFNTSGR